MPLQIPQDYFDDPSLHGDYQYETLRNVIDAMIVRAQDDDSYLKNTKRSLMLLHAKEGIQMLAQGVANDVLGIELTVPESGYLILPQDYVNWVRVSVVCTDDVTGGKHLQVLDINKNISTYTSYLQDNVGEILFDADGYPLEADTSNAYAQPYISYTFSSGYQPTLDTSQLHKHGAFNVDERGGRITFSSNLVDRNVVIEYVSDGLNAELREDQVTIHKHCVQALKDWIYYACIEQRMHVPASEKDRALRRFKTSQHKAKIARSGLNLQYIMRLMRQKTKTL